MNRLAGLSMLAAMVVVAAGSLAAQETGSTEQTPTVAEKPSLAPAQTSAGAEQVPVSKLPGDSHVRIVRLSQVQGKVGMDRGTGHGVEQSMQNLPIVEGLLLGTGNEESYAEVEFEDGSTMRLGPGTAIAFTQLVTRATGAKATTVRVDRGTVYVSRENTKADEFTLIAKGTKIAVQPSTHMRLELGGTKAEVAVFSGNVAVNGSGAPQMVGKKQTLTLDVADASSPVEFAKKVEEGPYDGWDKDAQQYHDRYAKGNALLGSGYGISDLNYYGAFATVDGCGTFWQPYFVGASWSPYATGTWARYGGGYSFVSPYPWGWLPFHSGGWSYCPSHGWGWQPGGSFVGVNNVALIQAVRGAPAHIPGGALPRPPADAKASMVVVNQQPTAISKPVAGGSFIFQKDSAGLGVPRGSLGKLNGFSNDVARHGSASSHMYIAPAGSSSQWNDGQVYHGPLAIHRGSMPDEARQAMWAREQATTNGSLGGHHEGQLAAGSGRGAQPGVSQNPSAGWQGRQGQPGALNTGNGGSNLGWKNQQGGPNSAANPNSAHGWNNSGAGNGAGLGAGAGNGHTWNAGGGGSAGGHTWAGGGGGQNANAGGGGHGWGGGAGAGSAGSSNSMGHAGGGSGNSGGGGGGHSSSSGSGSK